MFSGEPAAPGTADDATEYGPQCTLGCALAVWSMPEPEAARWACPAPARNSRQCDAEHKEQK